MTEEYPILQSASQITADLARELVSVPEWKSRVWVHELTGRQLDVYRSAMFKKPKGGGNLVMTMEATTLRLLALSLYGDDGNPLFPNTERGILELGDLPAGGSERLAKVARRLSGLVDEDAEAGDDDEGEAGDEGNVASFGASPNGGRLIDASTSVSRVTSAALSASS